MQAGNELISRHRCDLHINRDDRRALDMNIADISFPPPPLIFFRVPSPKPLRCDRFHRYHAAFQEAGTVGLKVMNAAANIRDAARAVRVEPNSQIEVGNGIERGKAI